MNTSPATTPAASPHVALAPVQRLDERTRELGRSQVRTVRAILRSTRATEVDDRDALPTREAA